MKVLRCCFAALAAAVVMAGPIDHETMWLMKRVGSPVPSPDGKSVIFQVTEPSYDSEEQVSDLWIAPVDGGAAPRRLTAGTASESGVNWSPDSSRIAFSAKREGDDKNQIYVLDVAGGGEARRITELTMGATDPVWSPDGKRILFHSRVHPGAGTEEANKKAEAERKDRKY
ncbi:MAG: S9 family peptidase, partial [bacterium]|nr:S9 family peptidase [bacterium]